ncbi:MAG: hypothetical protein ACK4OM_00030 [Alphaproteobacteria bacterium]
MKNSDKIYNDFREKQKQVFDSRAGWQVKPLDNKYGDKNDYNEKCMQSVENIAAKLKRFKISGKSNVELYKDLVESILKDLALDRFNIAQEKELKTGIIDPNTKYFGKWRTIPKEGEQLIADFTGMDGQHSSVNLPTKINLFKHLKNIFERDQRNKFLDNYPSETTGAFIKNKSKYFITHYFQTNILLTDSDDEKYYFSIKEFIEEFLNEGFLIEDFKEVIREFNTCPENVYKVFDAVNKRTACNEFKSIIEAKIEYRINDSWVPLTSHVTWFNDSEDKFYQDSVVVMLHTNPSSFHAILSEIGNLVKNIVEWKDSDGVDKLNGSVATVHYLLAHMMPTHRGSATMAKIFCKSLYFFHGFELVASKPGIEEDLYAIKQPYIEEFCKEYVGLFVSSPTSKKIPLEIALFQNSLSKSEELSFNR